jgi:glycosyltransferase involved in cell wall biosynthesis
VQNIPLAIISNGMPPYRLHLHDRIVREMPRVKLFSILTHDDGTSQWDLQLPAAIGPHHFGPGEPSALQSKPARALHEFKKGGRIIRFLRDHGVRAVVINGYNDPGRLRIIRWCRRHHVPCFVSGDSNVRGDQASGVKLRAKRILLGWLARNVTGLLPCGTLGRQFFQRYGADSSRIWFFPVEPDYDLIAQLPDERVEQARSKYQLDPARRRLVFSGRLVDVKRVDLLIDAFNAIAAERPQWDLVVVGDGPLRQSLQQRVKPQWAQRVIWTGFLADQADVTALYRCCDALVLPSDYDAWALVVNEAAAAGLALVCSDVVGAAAELLREGVNGRSFRKGEVESLREALLEVTDETVIDAYRRRSPQVLQEWRERGDPINGLRAALRAAGMLAPQ